MKIIRLLLATLLTIGLYFLLDTRLGELPYLGQIAALRNAPAVGNFLNPFGGFWLNAEPAQIAADVRLTHPKLKDKVSIQIDDRYIPHIFAKNDHDLYFAQGYMVAKLRLWQMEFLTHAASGRLSEIVGENPDALLRDRFQRRIGISYAAEILSKQIEKDPLVRDIAQAYADGVNAYIESLSPRDYPLEYKLLGYAPEPWSPYKSALLAKAMAQDLAYNADDYALSLIQKKYGKDITRELFPNYDLFQDPIIPSGTKFDFKKITGNKIPKNISVNADKFGDIAPKATLKELGSNNWAVAGSRTASGLPMLANDPHLTLNLPSIWIEMQLNAPKINVYGASIPGSPGILSGFNNNISWGVTNVDADVQDWYYIQFSDNERTNYKYADSTRPIRRRVEEIKIKGGRVYYDTVLYTHYGPIVAERQHEDLARRYGLPMDCALRWVAYEPSNELLSYYHLNRARNYDEYRKALLTYVCPAQNFVYADATGEVAITSHGKFPLKWQEQGKFILDGTNPAHEWNGWIPPTQNPSTRNPERGFVSSANQFPVDTLYPYYLHHEFAPYDRGKRINDVLASWQKATPKDMQALQNDNYSVRAKLVLPKMLKLLPTTPLSTQEKSALRELQRWQYQFNTDQIGASIFHTWIEQLTQSVWEDDIPSAIRRYPSSDKLLDMMMRADSVSSPRWFDDLRTPAKEGFAEMLGRSFRQTIAQLSKQNGNNISLWTWGNVRRTDIQHLGRIPAFSILGQAYSGSRYNVNKTENNTGPSWRMVVSLGRTPSARVIYPGGQSGNPGSHFYANFLPTWAKGELSEVVFLKSATDTHSRIVGKIRMSKE